MDRSVLLVLLSLQALLLISAFTSTDAAPLATDDQQIQLEQKQHWKSTSNGGPPKIGSRRPCGVQLISLLSVPQYNPAEAFSSADAAPLATDNQQIRLKRHMKSTRTKRPYRPGSRRPCGKLD